MALFVRRLALCRQPRVLYFVKSNYADTANFPDYGKTSARVGEHRLKRPTKRPPPTTLWDGLEGINERTKGSVIQDTLRMMEEDAEFIETEKKLKEFGQKKLTQDERKHRQRALNNLGVPSFLKFIHEQKQLAGVTETERVLHRNAVKIFQVNITRYCNQACNHCHVESSPKRTGEAMNRETVDRCIEVMKKSSSLSTLDITGGAPEMSDQFRYLASEGRKLGLDVIDRCNLTVLIEPGQEDTAEFLANNQIHIIASLPCYTSQNVNMQRGKGVFDRSIASLLKLNSLGYGVDGSGLVLDLVYNPLGNYLPPLQAELLLQYKDELWNNFGIVFNNLFTITNMPIKRFADFLFRRNELEGYMELLVRNFNLATLDNLMCLETLSISWNGQLFDCDLNQQLDMAMRKTVTTTTTTGAEAEKKYRPLTVWDINSTDELENYKIAVDNHCYGCTAGAGSSCQGVIV